MLLKWYCASVPARTSYVEGFPYSSVRLRVVTLGWVLEVPRIRFLDGLLQEKLLQIGRTWATQGKIHLKQVLSGIFVLIFYPLMKLRIFQE